MTGTILNAVAVIIGSLIGILLGNRLPDKVRETVLDGLGLMVLVVDQHGAAKPKHSDPDVQRARWRHHRRVAARRWTAGGRHLAGT